MRELEKMVGKDAGNKVDSSQGGSIHDAQI